ncbi:hypothetical protein PRIPAC_94825 [Pristionchus pacificus]|uniref:Uncharacterized protein n=1 Tax=Pristionchus pacificus TaxID=54126 RepID=A0A2A6CDV6_PRIPA|nr:hypothetical protein PRIPAC_94825 [Pristionchus pacificus]|eukprot:PDM76233.1 hypothetical protein PRIPAC_39837 [Pristionchus pacificus]
MPYKVVLAVSFANPSTYTSIGLVIVIVVTLRKWMDTIYMQIATSHNPVVTLALSRSAAER